MAKSSQNGRGTGDPARTQVDLSEEAQDNCTAVFHDVMRLRQRLQTMATNVASTLDLQSTEMSAIDTLGKFGPLTMGELARRSFISPTNTTRTVRNLVDRGLVRRERSPSSDREVIVRLTGAGRRIFAKSYPRMVADVNDLLAARLTSRERLSLARLLAKLVE